MSFYNDVATEQKIARLEAELEAARAGHRRDSKTLGALVVSVEAERDAAQLENERLKAEVEFVRGSYVPDLLMERGMAEVWAEDLAKERDGLRGDVEALQAALHDSTLAIDWAVTYIRTNAPVASRASINTFEQNRAAVGILDKARALLARLGPQREEGEGT